MKDVNLYRRNGIFRGFVKCLLVLVLLFFAMKWLVVDDLPRQATLARTTETTSTLRIADLISFSEIDAKLCKTKTGQPEIKTDVDCPEGNVVSVVYGGRLGNNVWEYASARALAKENGWIPYAPSCLLNRLNAMFSKLTIPSLLTIGRCKIAKSTLIDNDKFHNNATLIRELLKIDKSNTIILPLVTFVEEVIKNLQDIKEEFTMTKDLVDKTRRILLESAEGHEEPVTYIGVHVRRTDYASYLQKTNKTYSFAKPDFYHHAMEYFETRYRNTVFLIVSDDVKWCSKHLATAKNAKIISKFRGDPILDMAIMAACNHSVIDYGTYGVWGALLSGGETIVYNIDHKSTNTVTGLMPNWTYMN